MPAAVGPIAGFIAGRRSPSVVLVLIMMVLEVVLVLSAAVVQQFAAAVTQRMHLDSRCVRTADNIKIDPKSFENVN